MKKYLTEEEKRESALSVQTRVNVVTLAEIAQYWMNQGYYMRSVSQLVSWTLDLCREVLIENQKIIPSFDFISARKFMANSGLTQKSLERDNVKKAATATKLNMMRKEGYDPRVHDPRSYNYLHNKHSVSPKPDNIGMTGEYDKEAYLKAVGTSRQDKEASIKHYKDSGAIISESTMKEVNKRDEEQQSELQKWIEGQKQTKETL